MEKGTGTTILTTYFDKETSNKEFAEKKRLILEKDGVKISSREQLLYYEYFRKRFGKPSELYTDKTGIQCPNCKSFVKTKIQFCKVCGAYPI